MKNEIKEKMNQYASVGLSTARRAGSWLFEQGVLLDVGMSYAKQAAMPNMPGEEKTDEDRTRLLFKSAICTVLSSPLIRNVFAPKGGVNTDEEGA